MLAGHGWLNIIEKKGLLTQYSALGFSNPREVAEIVGLFEIVAAGMVLIKPYPNLIIVLLFWKIASELFYPKMEFFEWVERGGSYSLLFALWLILTNNTSNLILRKSPRK